MSILDKAKHMVFEESLEAKKAAQAPAVAPVAAAPNTNTHYSSPVVSGPVQDNSVYEKLRKVTDFDATDVGQLLQKYLAPLANLALDERSKFKAASVQAKAIDGLTDEKILATFDGLKVTLQSETDKFTASANHFEQDGVSSQQKDIDEMKKDIVKKQAALAQLQADEAKAETDLAIAVERLNQKRHDFSLAIMQRTSELDQQKAKYESLLKS